MKKLSFDAVVVGSGASGSAFAASLAESGKSVLILEAGPGRQASDLVSSGIWARRLKWGGAPVLEEGENPVGHVFNAGFGLGGSAMHHYAVWPRLHEIDFDCKTRYDQGLDWPIGYEDLRQHYDSVQRLAGVSGSKEQEIWRPPGADYPLPPVPVFQQGRILDQGFQALGLKTAPLPLAVNSIPYQGRSGCLWDGWCDAGCPIGALANPETIHLPIALSNGAVLKVDSPATGINTDTDGRFVTGVNCVIEGEETVVESAVTVLAAFAVQNPRLLLASKTEQHPQGLGNQSGLLGRYIMTHPAGLIYGLFEQETECYRGAFGGQLVNQDGYDKHTHKEQNAFGSYQWMIAQAVRPNDLLGIATTRPDLFGEDLDQFMRQAAKHFASMTAVVEDLPVADNRVTLSEQKDDHGVPLAKVSHTTHPKSKALWQAVLKEGQEVFKAAGAHTVWTGPQGSMHIMGGTIMGDDPSTSVTNSYGQLHGIPNLFVAGPGLFPTSGGVNPTFTIHALTERASQYLIQNWDSVAEAS